MRGRGLIAIGLMALPVLMAIWSIPYFITQDGPAHLQTATLLAELLSGDPWVSSYTHLQDYPLPNLLVQFFLAGMTSLLPGRVADQVAMSVTFAGVALAILWLRIAVRGIAGIVVLSPFVLVLSLGRLWLLGFYAFLVGAILFCIILGWWERTRKNASFRWCFTLALLLVLAWFSHLVSYGVTLIALGILLWAAPSVTRRQVAYTLAAAVPSLILAAWYLLIIMRHSSFLPHYLRLTSNSAMGWLQYLRSIKLISIARQTTAPFVEGEVPAFVVLAPAVLIGIVFTIWWVGSIKTYRRSIEERRLSRPWAIVACALIVLALLAPESFGAQHGGFLRERLLLLGLIASVPAWPMAQPSANRIGFIIALAALIGQTGFVWEYALRCDDQIRPLMSIAPWIPDRSRIFVVGQRPGNDKFRASPTLHAANLLGVGRPIIVWNNYQGNLYFFPVNFRPPFPRCSEDGLCEIQENRDRIDVVVLWPDNERVAQRIQPWFPRRLDRDSSPASVYGRR